MPLFNCSRCGAIENTALGAYWNERRRGEPVLCSECATGKWHGVFPKEQGEIPPKEFQPMTDDSLVERLLTVADYLADEGTSGGSTEILTEAADRIEQQASTIERMEEALRCVRAMLGGYAGQPNFMGDVFKIVDAALTNKEPTK